MPGPRPTSDTPGWSFTFWRLVPDPDRHGVDGLPAFIAMPYITLYEGMLEIHQPVGAPPR